MTAMIQDRKTGKYLPYPENDDGLGNVLIDGVLYSNGAGKAKYAEMSAAPPTEQPSYENPGVPIKPEDETRLPEQIGDERDLTTPPPDNTAGHPQQGVTYDLDHVDAQGKNVYRGSDGLFYTDDPTGMNGMGRYTAPAAAAPPPPATATSGGSGGGGTGGGGGGTETPTPTPTTPPVDIGSASGGGGGTGTGTPTTPPKPAVDPAWLKNYIDAGGKPFEAPEGSTLPGPFEYPDWVAPEDFKGVSKEDLYADPSYQFRLDESMGALQNSATGKGLLNSGGTLHDLLGLGSQFASTEYGNVWDRALGTWKTNYGKSLDTYATNRGNAADIYGTKVNSATDIYNRGRKEWQEGVDDYYTNRDAGWKKIFDSSTLGAGAATSL